MALYEDVDAPIIRTSIRVAEMIKYTSNAWHALKVCFANEIGNIASAVGVDGHEVMDIFCQDKKLNLSPYYMGRASRSAARACRRTCARCSTARGSWTSTCRCIQSMLRSNKLQIQHAFDMVMRPARSESACSASASRPAPTTCARARWSYWPKR